jgi:hypothetical protein
MIKQEGFKTGYLKIDMENGEEIFLSVTPGFEYGPGIQRDGITKPRMTHPQSIAYVSLNRSVTRKGGLPPTTNSYEQRVGTWTLYDHLREFIDKKGKDWRIMSVQSNGDLTANPWHVVYLADSHISNSQKGIFCGLFTDGDPKEAIDRRIYRCLVKWNAEVSKNRRIKYEFISLKMSSKERGNVVEIEDPDYDKSWLEGIDCYDKGTGNIARCIEFALSGKTIVKKGYNIPILRAIDRFQDIRHILGLIKVKAEGEYKGESVDEVYLGEYQLYSNLNERRAAMLSPVIVNLNIENSVTIDLDDALKKLKSEHFKFMEKGKGRPVDRYQFREYPDDVDKIEIFFSHAVYPFGAIGMSEEKEIISFVSGGLGGRIGNTLEGIIDTMYYYFKCDNAMVLDEGFDSCLIVNPKKEDGSCEYSNEELLKRVLAFTKWRTYEDEREAKVRLGDWDLNREIFRKIDEDDEHSEKSDKEYKKLKATKGYQDIFLVEPKRSQIRSVIIYAIEERNVKKG